MKNYICPFCESSVPIIQSTYREDKINFYNTGFNARDEPVYGNVLNVIKRHCPTCDEVSFVAIGEGNLGDICVPIYPTSLAKQFPEYIPEAIKEDYEEAYSIVNASPKASATLSRRCLQGMIRDFWGISENNLYEEINKIKDKVTASQWKAIDAVRSIGNIGAHMKKDINEIVNIEPDEAEKLLKLIELLINKWYIARYDEEELTESIVEIKEQKKEETRIG